jgi:hypothetical protein
MKELKKEIRLFIAEKLLTWSFGIAPFGEEGEQIKIMLAYYFDAKVKEHK